NRFRSGKRSREKSFGKIIFSLMKIQNSFKIFIEGVFLPERESCVATTDIPASEFILMVFQ
ncbi:MAG: hypothetical protein Q4G16_09235, partial [Cruoricaptor ignavus]|nr:hypothetical protein [Cruoricaptor ignavus]